MGQSRSETPTEEEHPAVPPLSELEKEWGKPPVITGKDRGIPHEGEEEGEPKPKPKKIKRTVKKKRKTKRKKAKKRVEKRPKKKVRKARKKG